MSKYTDNVNSPKDILYNNVLLLSRNITFYTKFDLIDTFQNRINLIFIHISFLFIQMKNNNKENLYKSFYQNLFDLVFKKIEINMREIGYGDTVINKNMKFLVKIFYSILLNCQKYKDTNEDLKIKLLRKYLKTNNTKNITNIMGIIDYFNKYEAFCLDLNSDSVLKGELNFNYK